MIQLRALCYGTAGLILGCLVDLLQTRLSPVVGFIRRDCYFFHLLALGLHQVRHIPATINRSEQESTDDIQTVPEVDAKKMKLKCQSAKQANVHCVVVA